MSRVVDALERQVRCHPPRAGDPEVRLLGYRTGGLDQVGCVYTAQGFEFDYVGVIFGSDLVYRGRDGWVGQPEHS